MKLWPTFLWLVVLVLAGCRESPLDPKAEQDITSQHALEGAAPTVAAQAQTVKLDYIYLEKNSALRALKSWVVSAPAGASDHMPISATLTWQEGRSKMTLPD